jgi:hypothetical protein
MRRAVWVFFALCGVSRGAGANDWHPYVFSVDGSTLGRRSVAVESGVGYNGVTGSGGGLSPDDARRVAAWVSGAVGIVDRVEIDGAFLFGDDPTNGFGFNQARVDLRVQVLEARPRFPVAVSLGAGYQADALLDNAVTGVAAATAYLGRVNLTLNVRAAHYFHAGRDPVDVFVTAGALVRATNWLRLGAEYVGEELEGAVSDDADHSPGGRHYVGPTAALFFAGAHLRINATSGAVITQGRAGPLIRGSLAYVF